MTVAPVTETAPAARRRGLRPSSSLLRFVLRRIGAFVLLADRYEAELAADFESEYRFVLTKPLADADLERVLASIDSPDRARDPVV